MSHNRKLVPGAEKSLDRLKHDIAMREGIGLTDGYNGDMRAKDAGAIGGNMVKKMITDAENQMKNSK
jgi:small acid-soluble spore protein D (minor alpha/beta-type SASP)